MKKKTLRAAAILCLLLPALPLAAQDDGDYAQIGRNSIGSYSLYVPSVEVRDHYSGEYIVGWVRWTYSDEGAEEYGRDGVKAHHSMDFYAANPKARQFQSISAIYYDSEGRAIYSNDGSFNSFAWRECTPGTTGEAIWRALMEAAGYR